MFVSGGRSVRTVPSLATKRAELTGLFSRRLRSNCVPSTALTRRVSSIRLRSRPVYPG
jgi:hypothetical protein